MLCPINPPALQMRTQPLKQLPGWNQRSRRRRLGQGYLHFPRNLTQTSQVRSFGTLAGASPE